MMHDESEDGSSRSAEKLTKFRVRVQIFQISKKRSTPGISRTRWLSLSLSL
jgi:hypothetical protein